MGSLHVERRIKASCGEYDGCTTWRDNLRVQVKIHVRYRLHVKRHVKVYVERHVMASR
jgi:hypothetical protein